MTSSLLPQDIEKLATIVQELTPIQRQSIQNHGHIWKLIDDIKNQLTISPNADLLRKCEELRRKTTAESVIGEETLKMILAAPHLQQSRNISQSQGIWDGFISTVTRKVTCASYTLTSKPPPVNPKEVGLSRENWTTIETTVSLFIRYLCHQLIQYENSTEPLPKFMQPFLEKDAETSVWKVTTLGLAIKDLFLEEEKGSYSLKTGEPESFCAIVTANLHSILCNFKKASEEGFPIPKKIYTDLPAVLEGVAEKNPNLTSLSEPISQALLSVFLPKGIADLHIPTLAQAPGISKALYSFITDKVHHGIHTILQQTDNVLSAPSSDRAQEKPETSGEDFPFKIINPKIFSLQNAVDLDALLSNVPFSKSTLPGFTSLRRIKEELHMTPTQGSLSQVISEFENNLLLSIFRALKRPSSMKQQLLQESIDELKKQLTAKEIQAIEIVPEIINSFLQQTKETLLEKKDTLNEYEKIWLQFLENEATHACIVKFLESTTLSIINNFLNALAENTLVIPKEILDSTQSDQARAQALAQYILRAIGKNSLPLPLLLSPLRIDSLLLPILTQQMIPLIPQIDATLRFSLPKEDCKEETIPSSNPLTISLLPEDRTRLTAFGASLAKFIIEKTLPQAKAPPQIESLPPEVQNALQTIPKTLLSHFKELLDPTRYSSASPPQENLIDVFDRKEGGTYQLNTKGILLTSLLANEELLSPYLSASLSQIFMQITTQIEEKKIAFPKFLDPSCTNQEEEIRKWVLPFLQKDTLILPPFLEPLRENIHAIIVTMLQQKIPTLLQKLDTMGNVSKKEESKKDSLDEKLKEPIAILGGYLGKLFIEQSDFSKPIEMKKRSLLSKGFTEASLEVPRRIFSELIEALQIELEKTEFPAEGIFQKIFFQKDDNGTFKRNELGTFISSSLKDPDFKEKLLQLLELSFLSLLENACTSPNSLLNILDTFFDSVTPLLQNRETLEQKEASFQNLHFKDVIKLSDDPAINAGLSILTTLGIKFGVRKLEENIPQLLEVFFTPTRPIKKKVVDAIAGIPPQASDKTAKTHLLPKKFSLFIKALFPEINISQVFLNLLAEKLIHYLKIPTNVIAESILSTLLMLRSKRLKIA